MKLFIGLLWFALVAPAFSAPVKFDIPAQPAPAALKLFIKQSGTQVAYSAGDLKGVNTNAVAGDFEPEAALGLLLKGSGFTANLREKGWFVVVREKAVETTGAVKGSLIGAGGARLPDVLVAIKETGQSAETDKFGQYVFPKIATGTYVLVATAPGYQPLHITGVQVRAGRELTLGKEEMRKAKEGVLSLEPFVVTADAVLELDPFSVEGQKVKPFTTANMDIPRTINDAQPYYIIDSKTIDQSGAVNIEDMLKTRLTMNTVAQVNGQISGVNTAGNTSSINLRGLGIDKTLILVNGRRAAGVTINGFDQQPDLNGIPLAAVDRIEVLPSSASGIYGGSAIGGVVNVILKREYSGGEIRTTYDNTWDTDSPKRTLSASYGFRAEGGKTQVMLNASWNDATPLLYQDRRELFERGLNTILLNRPAGIFTSNSPFLGSLPNIAAAAVTATTLTLKNGTILPSRNTFVPAGTAPSASAASLYSSLAANAGIWNLELPASTQTPTGLLRPIGTSPSVRFFGASIRREMSRNIEAFAEFSRKENNAVGVNNPFSAAVAVPATAPTSPFTTTVAVRFPTAANVTQNSNSCTDSFALGATIKLPHDWTAVLDFSRSVSRYGYEFYLADSTALTADLNSGLLNPFVDTLLYPLNLEKYLQANTFTGSSVLEAYSLRGSGGLFELPWGSPMLTFGLEHRNAVRPEGTTKVIWPVTTSNNKIDVWFERQQVTDSAYAELKIPLVREDQIAMVRALEFQLSGRSERYTVDAGTPRSTSFFNRVPLVVTYFAPAHVSPDGTQVPFKAKATYVSTNYTVGVKYKPATTLTVRASYATAFLPPTPEQLIKDPEVSPFLTTIFDPKTNISYDVKTIGNGNPDLKPQHSESINVGVIWAPTWKSLRGLRFNAEYYLIDQFDAIGGFSTQGFVNLETAYPDRVSRDSTGRITVVDTSLVNLFKRSTEGLDFSVDYQRNTSAGVFSVRAAHSRILHLKQQVLLTLPNLEYLDFPSEGGAAKYKLTATLGWERGGWNAAWSTNVFSSYKQSGAVGGPSSIQNANGGVFGTNVAAQGSDTIPSQTYHDVFASYAFLARPGADNFRTSWGSRILANITVQIGVRNVFNTLPPVDVFYNTYYTSPYGDTRLRSYWISVKKAF